METSRMALRIVVFLGCLLRVGLTQAETLERIISREDPNFDCANAGLVAGHDGKVYLYSVAPVGRGAYVLRINCDGIQKSGGEVPWDGFNEAAVNADGVIATAHAHFAHAVTMYDKGFQKIGACADFRMPGPTSAPTSVDSGASGDFYGLDHVAEHVLRLSPAGKIVQVIEFKNIPGVGGVRVSEAAGQLYLAFRGGICAVGFDGVERWKVGGAAVWTVDDAGTVYALQGADEIKRWSAAGAPLPSIKLAPGAGSQAKITQIAIFGSDLLVKRYDPAELFQVYDLAFGKFVRNIPSAHERVSAEFPNLVWTAGAAIPFTLNASGLPLSWHVRATPFGDTDWRELNLQNGKLEVPADYAGLYQVRIAPTLNAAALSEYTIRAVVEVRAPGSKGTASVWTPLNRVHWARGEAIPVSVVVRTTNAVGAVKVTLREIRPGGPPAPAALASAAAGPPIGETVVWSTNLTLTANAATTFTLPASFTAQLASGRYDLRADIAGFTCVVQPLRLGQPLASATPFRIMQYGDYGSMNSTADLWGFADTADDMLDYSLRTGVNQYVNRTNFGRYPTVFVDNENGQKLERALQTRLAADPAGVATQKVMFGFAQAHVLGAFSAHDMREWLLPVTMDDSLPLTVVAAGKKESPAQGYAGGIKGMTPIMQQFLAFAGWDWVANWWASRDAAFTSPELKTEYLAALKKAKETGEWASILDTVGDRVVNWQPEAQQCFKDAMDAVGGKSLHTASSGPYRRPEVYPPVCFSNVDEVDLHYQCEQITTPNWTPHAVDFYKRPGKPAWIHPEFAGDTGTGEQILPMSFLALMRGANGIGKEGGLPQWGPIGTDPRSAYAGMPSVYRALYRFARMYGPWLSTLENADTVAIPVSCRHVKLEGFEGGLGGIYFTRLWTAYQDCLYAHRPATFVFAEDRPDLSRFKAVLLVGLRYEPEPAFAAMVDKARKAGATVFADDSCRDTLVKDATPLGFAFSEKLGGMNDDTAYWNCEQTFRADAPKLAEKLAGSVPAMAEIDAYGVLPTLRRSPGGARYLWLVNNTRTALEPGVHWRVSAGMTATMPVVTKVTLSVAPGEVVYDVFAGKDVSSQNSESRIQFDADLRFTCARLYAILPARIDGVNLNAPQQINPGASVAWDVAVRGGASGSILGNLTGGAKIKTAFPVRVALLDNDGTVVEERFTTTGSGSFAVPINGKSPFTISATELISGKSVQCRVASGESRNSPNPESRTLAPTTYHLPPATSFGPHLRDLAISADGKSALLNALNWGQNLYSIDIVTGKPLWTGKIGDHFAFSPVPFGNGFAAQGFDLATGEGYHLYLMDAQGQPQRRFALPGLPARMVAWCFTANLNDHIANFAVAPDSSWVAAAGNLALACWKPDGSLLWSQDWSQEKRQSPCLLAVDEKTLLMAQGLRLRALNPRSGKEKWGLDLTGPGEIQGLTASADGKTIVVRANTQGGRLSVVRSEKIVATIPTAADAVALASDGAWLAVTTERSLKAYTAAGAPLWSFSADSLLRFPRAAADGKRLAVASELGTLYVLDIPAGRLLHQADLGAIATTAWLPDGDFLAATWMGTVVRLAPDMKEKWRINLANSPFTVHRSLFTSSVPTARLTSWVNAELKPWPLTPNLLTASNVNVSATAGDRCTMEVNDKELFDGLDKVPEQPLMDWFNTSMINSGWRGDFSLVFDTWRAQLRVEAITLVEDPSHPESWIRDARLEYWDTARSQWAFAQYLTADTAVHTHKLVKPIEARKFRLTKPDGAGWGTGNLRLAEIVFHGAQLGCSHPDAQANRPVAVLFDEEKNFTPYAGNGPYQFEWRTGPEAASGALYMALKSEGGSALLGDKRFAQQVPDWDFEIVEKPEKPGQYRWLQFSCKVLAKETCGCSLILGYTEADAKYYPKFLSSVICIDIGDSKAVLPCPRQQLPDKLTTDWTAVRVDLWPLIQKLPETKRRPFRVRGFNLTAVGGGVAFDRILLGRTEADLKASRPIRP